MSGTEPLTLHIRFGKSNSIKYPQAARKAAKLPGYTHRVEDGFELHSIDMPIPFGDLAVWRKVQELAKLVRDWKGSEIELTGCQDQKNLISIDNIVTDIGHCYARRQKAKDPDAYCLSVEDGWPTQCAGCQFLPNDGQLPNGEFDSLDFYNFGALNAERDRFDVDKPALLESLRHRAAEELCVHCPGFSWARVERDLEARIPNSLQLGPESEYVLRHAERDPTRVVGIKPRRAEPPQKPSALDEDAGDELQNETRMVPTVRFADIAGQDRALEEVRTMIQLPIMHPEYFSELGVAPQQGVILYGPPGNGKTLLAKAAAAESGAHLEIINGPEIMSMWLGESERGLRKLFERAKRLQPSIVLIDEIDSIAPARDREHGHHTNTLVAQLLVLLDGLVDRGRVIVIATTNRVEAVDPAIRRPGRFDYQIEVPLPDASGRAAIMERYLSRLKVANDVDPKRLAGLTDQFSGAELASVCREAGLIAIKRAVAAREPPDKVRITLWDLQAGVNNVRAKRA